MALPGASRAFTAHCTTARPAESSPDATIPRAILTTATARWPRFAPLQLSPRFRLSYRANTHSAINQPRA